MLQPSGPWIPAVVLAAAVGFVPAPANAAPIVALEGPLHELATVGSFSWEDGGSPFAPHSTTSGDYSLYADTDLRSDPRAAVLRTDAGGWLVALTPELPRLLGPARRDPDSGRTVQLDAPEDALCATGDEPDCWQPGDPLEADDVVEALCAAIGAEPDTCRFRQVLWRAPAPPPNVSMCSPATPQFCSGLGDTLALLTLEHQPLSDDSLATSHGRWVWEAGAELEIAAAGGEFGPFDGGKLFVLGPERSRVYGLVRYPIPDIPGATFLLVSSDLAEPPLLLFGAPEPQAGALTAVALAALVVLARRRRARR
jgi:hypothetical protein